MKRHSPYKNYVSTHYTHVAPATEASFRKRYYVWRSYLKKFLPVSRESSILEIGCGVGHNLFALKKLGFTNLTGTDYSAECVVEAKKQGFDARLVNESTEKIFYIKHKGVFDCIIFYDIIEHCEPEEATKMLVSAKTMLRPNGTVIISLPNADHPFSNTLLFADVTHKFIYNPNSLSQLLRSSGFQSISMGQMNSWTTYDDNVILRIVKNTILRVTASMGELMLKSIAFSQGIVLKECKPTLVACAERTV